MYVKKICCIGADFVGGPFSSIIALKCPEIQVTVIDLDQERIRSWNSKKLPIFEPGLDEMVLKCRNINLFFSTDTSTPIKEADIIFICTNTPLKKHGFGSGKAADLKYLEDAARLIANEAERFKIIVEKSTVPIRAAETVKTILKANQRPHSIFQVLSNPEFLSEGSAIQDLLHPERILIGGGKTPDAKNAIESLITVYEHWVPRSIIIVADTWSSELSKIATNAFLAQRLSSINALSELCEITNADITEVASAIGMDSRIGSKFLEASIGFGGPTLHKDVTNLVYLCESLNLPLVANYWQKVLDINDYQKKRFAKKIVEAFFNTLTEKHLAILGFAFQKNTSSTENSPAIYVCKVLLEEGARLKIFDPALKEEAIMEELQEACGEKFDLSETVKVLPNAYDAIDQTNGIVLCTDWAEFKKLDYFKLYQTMLKPAYIFDGCKSLAHKELSDIGYTVYAIGKHLVNKTQTAR